MFELPDFGSVQIVGADASKVINNLCTNDIKKLSDYQCCEAFVTNVRGWCVEHGFVFKQPNEIKVVGLFGNAAALCAHIDRYIVREDAKIVDLSGSVAAFLLSREEAAGLAEQLPAPELIPSSGTITQREIGSLTALVASIRMLASDDLLVIVNVSERESFIGSARAAGIELGDSAEFERRRIASLWPKAGKEILEKTIPQELDRDESAISFTKGCYLGQETIARLDAIGQLQKKLCLVRIESNSAIDPGTAILKEDQQVGQVTSSAADSAPAGASPHQLALAYLRRGNFEAGTRLTCNGVAAIVQKVGL